jgi:hypothetical protein
VQAGSVPSRLRLCFGVSARNQRVTVSSPTKSWGAGGRTGKRVSKRRLIENTASNVKLGRLELLDRHENRMPDLPLNMLRQVAFSRRILDQDYLASSDDPALAVTGSNFDPGVEIDNVLPAWCRMPVNIVLRLGLAKDYTVGRQALG